MGRAIQVALQGFRNPSPGLEPSSSGSRHQFSHLRRRRWQLGLPKMDEARIGLGTTDAGPSRHQPRFQGHSLAKMPKLFSPGEADYFPNVGTLVLTMTTLGKQGHLYGPRFLPM